MAYNPENAGEASHRPDAASRTKKASGPHPVDAHVGLRLRQRRTLMGLTQEKLGDALGLTFQQVQKYERGTNRIGASRLFHLSQLLSVPVSYFFDDMPDAVVTRYTGRDGEQRYNEGNGGHNGFADTPQNRLDDDPMARKETMDLVRAYYSIDDTASRRRLLDLVRTMAKASED